MLRNPFGQKSTQAVGFWVPLVQPGFRGHGGFAEEVRKTIFKMLPPLSRRLAEAC